MQFSAGNLHSRKFSSNALGSVWLNAVLALSLLALLINTFVLLHRINVLNGDVAHLALSKAPPVGGTVPWISGHDLGGNPLRINYLQQSDPTLLLVFSTHCNYCVDNWPYWHRLLSDLPRVHVVFADIDGASDLAYFQQNGVQSPTVIDLDPAMKPAYNLMVTPTTVAIGPHGAVLASWPGILTEGVVHQIEQAVRSKN